MVFFTSIIIVLILYFLQTDGLIYVTIIAVVAELINIFMAQTLTKSVEKKLNTKFKKIVDRYKAKIVAQKKTIKELENIQEESVRKLYKANMKIKEYEEKLEEKNSEPEPDDGSSPPQPHNPLSKETKKPEEKKEEFIDLPSGSNRKELPI
jgi:ABC-type oligopeptide transport system ATPase subunit